MNSINPMNPRTAKVTLYQGDDLARIQELRDEADRLKPAPSKQGEKSSTTAAEAADYSTALEAHNEFLAGAEQRAVTVTLRGIGRKLWRKLVSEHPPTDDDETATGVNDSTFADALVPVSIASPVFGSDSARDEWLDSLSDIQFEHLYVNAFSLNRMVGATPKAIGRSETSRSDGETSSSPAASD